MSHYTISTFQPGKGDYGTDWKVVEDRKMTFGEARHLAQSYRNLLRTKVCVFKGRNLGKIVEELSDNPDTGSFERCNHPLCTYCGNIGEAWMCNACRAVYCTEAEAAGCPCPGHTHARTKLTALPH